MFVFSFKPIAASKTSRTQCSKQSVYGAQRRLSFFLNREDTNAALIKPNIKNISIEIYIENFVLKKRIIKKRKH